MADDRPQNFWQVLTGAAGTGLETLGRSKAEEKQRALPEALSIFSTILQAERAQEARALNRIQRKEATINVDIKGLQLQKMLELQKLGFDNPVELEEAMLRIRGEVDLEKTKSLMDMVEEETGVTTIPSGLKPFEEPRGPEELGVDAALREAAKRGKLEELGVPVSTTGEKTLSAKDQWYKSYLDESLAPDEARQAFADYINPETGPEEKKEYYRILRAQIGGAFFNVKDPEALKSAQQFAAKTSLWLPEANAPLRDVLDGLRRKLKNGKIDQAQYDDAIAQINVSLAVENVEEIFGRGR